MLNLLVSERTQPAGWFTDSRTREWNRKGRVEGEQDVEKRGRHNGKGKRYSKSKTEREIEETGGKEKEAVYRVS